MDCSTPGLPVHHQLPELTKTHVHWVGDAIQPSHPLSSPSPPTFNLSQHQGLFKWVSSLHQVATVLEFQPCVIPNKTEVLLRSPLSRTFSIVFVLFTLFSISSIRQKKLSILEKLCFVDNHERWLSLVKSFSYFKHDVQMIIFFLL